MRPDRLRAIAWPVALVTGAAALAVLLRSPVSSFAVRAWLVALGALALWAAAGAALEGWHVVQPPRRTLTRFWRRRRQPDRLRQLEGLEHAVEFAQGTSFDLHFRLRPHLVRIAEHRLALRGVSLTAQPRRAEALVGGDAWELIRPDRPEPDNRSAPGAPLPVLKRVVDQIDEI